MGNRRSYVIPATMEHAKALQGQLRDVDQRECQALVHMSADQALYLSLNASPVAWTAIVNDAPAFVFGVASRYRADPMGQPWLLASDRITDVGVRVVRRSRFFVEKMLSCYNYLENLVAQENEVSKRWLAWCGFHIEPAEPFGDTGFMVHRFWLHKEGSSSWPFRQRQ